MMLGISKKYSKLTLFGFIVLGILAVPGIFKLKINNNFDQMINKKSDSYQNLTLIEKQFGTTNNLYVLITNKEGNILSKKSLTLLHKVENQINLLPGVNKTISVLSNPDIKLDTNGLQVGHLIEKDHINQPKIISNTARNSKTILKNFIFNNKATIIIVNIKNKNVKKDKLNRDIQKIIANNHNPLHTIFYVGLMKIEYYINKETIKETIQLTCICALLLLVVLYIFTRSFKAITIIIVTTALSCTITLGCMGLLGIEINILSLTTPILILIIGSTELTHLIEAFNKERKKNNNPLNAIENTISSIYPSIILTSLTTMTGTLSLSFSKLKMVQILSMAATLGMAITAAITLFLTPALFSILYKKPIKNISRTTSNLEPTQNKIIKLISIHDKKILSCFFIVIAISLYMATSIIPNYSILNLFKSHPVKDETYKIQNTTNSSNDLYMEVKSKNMDAFLHHKNLSGLLKITEYLNKQSSVGSASSFASIIAHINKRFNHNKNQYYAIPNDDTIEQYINIINQSHYSHFINADFNNTIIRIRHNIHGRKSLLTFITKIKKQAIKTLPNSFSVTITSKQLAYLNSFDSLLYENIYSILALVVGLYILFVILFQSVTSGLLCVVINLTPLLLLGGTTALLNISPSLGCIIAFVLVFTIAVDDTIHFFTKFSHFSNAHKTTENTIKDVFKCEFRPVLFSSASVIIGFTCLLSSNLSELIIIGKLVPFGVFYALICDLLLAPALLRKFRIINIIDLVKKNYNIQTLQKCPMFNGLNLIDIKKTLLYSHIIKIKKGSVFIKKGARSKSMFILLEGDADVTTGSGAVTITSGAVLGEIGYFSNTKRTCNVTARTNLTAIELDSLSLNKHMRFNKKILLKLNRNAIAIIIQRLLNNSSQCKNAKCQ